MSRVVKAINPDAPCQIEMNAGLMLDPGSTGTYISSELSQKLRLYNALKKDIGLIQFGDKSVSVQIKGTLNVRGIRDVEGNIMRIRAGRSKKPTERMREGRQSQSRCEFWTIEGTLEDHAE